MMTATSTTSATTASRIHSQVDDSMGFPPP
jgi:hypothetical protein